MTIRIFYIWCLKWQGKIILIVFSETMFYNWKDSSALEVRHYAIICDYLPMFNLNRNSFFEIHFLVKEIHTSFSLLIINNKKKIPASMLTKQPQIWYNMKVKIENEWNIEKIFHVITGGIPLVLRWIHI